MEPDRYPGIDDRRQASRFDREEGTDFAVIWRQPGEEELVEVHDESLGGLSIVVDPQLGLEVGDRLHVAYAGGYSEGIVRHVEPAWDGRVVVGMECH